MVTLVRIALRLIEDALRWVLLLFRSTESVHAENLFLRRQLALYIERGVGLHFCGAQSKAAFGLLQVAPRHAAALSETLRGSTSVRRQSGTELIELHLVHESDEAPLLAQARQARVVLQEY
jgi:hypothetical protein